jgi:hypothetical protein
MSGITTSHTSGLVVPFIAIHALDTLCNYHVAMAHKKEPADYSRTEIRQGSASAG